MALLPLQARNVGSALLRILTLESIFSSSTKPWGLVVESFQLVCRAFKSPRKRSPSSFGPLHTLVLFCAAAAIFLTALLR